MARQTSDPVTRHLPLSPPAFHTLLALADAERHAYGILKEVERRSEGRVRFSASTLYDVVQRLEHAGLIREATSRPDPAHDDERRRYFEITPLGRQVGEAEAQRLEEAVTLAREKRFLSRPRSAEAS